MKYVKEHINEEFTEESDPIDDLGIGLKGRLKKEYDIIIKKDSREKAKYFFNNNTLQAASGAITNMIKHAIVKRGKLNSEFFINLLSEEIHKQGLTSYGVKIVKNYFNKKFNITFDEEKKNVNEKFTNDDSDPIQDMGIGYEKKFKEFSDRAKREYYMSKNSEMEDITSSLICEIISGDYNKNEGLQLLNYIITQKKLNVNTPTIYESCIDENDSDQDTKISIEIFELLFKNGLDIHNENIFLYAIENDYSEKRNIINYLIKKGANINANDSEALDAAIGNEDNTLIYFLIKHGINTAPWCENLLKYAIEEEDKKLIVIAMREYIKKYKIKI